jgi:hypothetical protein
MRATVDLEGRLLRPAPPERFGPAELDGLPDWRSASPRGTSSSHGFGWHRFGDGEFFRYRTTELQPVGPAGAGGTAAGSR